MTGLMHRLSTTLTARLILNIRDPSLRRSRRASDQYTTTDDDTTAASEPSFAMSPYYTLTQIEAGVETRCQLRYYTILAFSWNRCKP